MRNGFEKYLLNKNMSKNTIAAYTYTASLFEKMYSEPSKDNALSFKGYLLENFKVKTVNLRIQAINKYFEYLRREDLKLIAVKIQQKPFLENVISNADYEFLKNSLQNGKNWEWYFIVRYLGATGARISELVQFKIEHVQSGYLDIYSKGGKTRRIYIPKSLQEETIRWLSENGRGSGYLFLNQKGTRITTRGISIQLKKLAVKYGINPDVVYPHSFRHRFAKNFIEKYNDISLLADLMGHDSIETTRVYLRRSSTEQREIVDTIITW